MIFEKTHLDDIVRCYCASHMDIDDKCYAFFASENPSAPCYSYTGENFETKEVVWEDTRGGCMSIIPFKTRKGEFLAVNEFYLKVSPSHAKLVWGKKTETGWEVKDVFNLPYLHRFDIYHIDGKDFVVCATIARDKANKEDWTRPGQIYVGEIPADLENENVVLRQVADGLYRNHGYTRGQYNGNDCGYFGCDSGLYRLTPVDGGKDWNLEKLMDGKIGEIAIADIDGDGKEEFMTIEPFHGNAIHVYHEKDGGYERVYTYPNEIDFAHALVGTTLGGKPCFVAGIRRINCEIFVLTYENGEFVVHTVDTGVGPANLDVIHHNGKEYILGANHTLNEAAIYEVK
ncbi:MAG: hypothetical protein Q4B60_04830 [Erysipelotrichaceae bacterium]|nr:hypothetical protein [Erysipelotrichaceae bacterium]